MSSRKLSSVGAFKVEHRLHPRGGRTPKDWSDTTSPSFGTAVVQATSTMGATASARLEVNQRGENTFASFRKTCREGTFRTPDRRLSLLQGVSPGTGTAKLGAFPIASAPISYRCC